MNVRYETKAWMPPMVISPSVICSAAIANDETQRNRGDDLHSGQEERGEPRGAIGGVVHLGGQPLELAGVFILTPQRLDHARALKVFVERACDLAVGAA